jgi:hypothetical protein
MRFAIFLCCGRRWLVGKSKGVQSRANRFVRFQVFQQRFPFSGVFRIQARTPEAVLEQTFVIKDDFAKMLLLDIGVIE